MWRWCAWVCVCVYHTTALYGDLRLELVSERRPRHRPRFSLGREDGLEAGG